MNWPIVRIADFCKTGSGGTPSRGEMSKYYGGNIPWVKSGELKDEILLSTEEHITQDAIQESSARLVPRGGVLVAMYGATVGRTALLGIEAATNQAVCHIVPNKHSALAKYVWYYLRANVPELLRRRVGGAQPNISQQIIKDTRIPLPTLREQQRIVEMLDQAEAIRKKRVEADTKVDRILPSLFYKMFGHSRRNPRGLKKIRLGDLIKVKSGEFLPAKQMDPEGKYPVYGGNGINGYHSAYMFEIAQVVIGRVGIYCGAVHYTEPRCWVTDNALYVAEMSTELHPRYLAEALRVANLNQYAGRAGQPLISAGRIYPIEILVPPQPDQERFANMVERLETLSVNRMSSKEKLEILFSALLHRAFSGNLTAKWREAHVKELLAEMEQQSRALADEGVTG